jgi:hypothetical protein
MSLTAVAAENRRVRILGKFGSRSMHDAGGTEVDPKLGHGARGSAIL